MTGESSNCTVKVRQQEVAKQPTKVIKRNWKTKKLCQRITEGLTKWNSKDFQEAMNQAIEQLLNKLVRRHSCRKDKPELCMEQGKHKESISKEAETLPPINISRGSDNE